MTGCITWTVEPSDWKIIQFSHFRFDYLYLAIVLFISNVYKSPHARNSIPTIITEKSAKATQNQLKRDFFPANFMILLKRKNRNGRSNFNFSARDAVFHDLWREIQRTARLIFYHKSCLGKRYANCPKFSRQYKQFLIKSNYLYS